MSRVSVLLTVLATAHAAMKVAPMMHDDLSNAFKHPHDMRVTSDTETISVVTHSEESLQAELRLKLDNAAVTLASLLEDSSSAWTLARSAVQALELRHLTECSGCAMPLLIGVTGDIHRHEGRAQVEVGLQVDTAVMGVVRKKLKTPEKYAHWVGIVRKSIPEDWAFVTYSFTENGALYGGKSIHPGRELFSDVDGTYGGTLSGTIDETDNCCFGMTNVHVKPHGKTIYKGNRMIGRFDSEATGGSEVNTDSYVFKILKGVNLVCQSGRAGKTDLEKCPPQITGAAMADDGDEVFKVGQTTGCTIGTVQKFGLFLCSGINAWRKVATAFVSPEGAPPEGDPHESGAWTSHPFTRPGDSGSWVVRKRDGKVIGLNRGWVQQRIRTRRGFVWGEHIAAFAVAVDMEQILEVHTTGGDGGGDWVQMYEAQKGGVGNELRSLVGAKLKTEQRMNQPGRIKNLAVATTASPCTPCK